MILSDYIKALQAIEAEHGDLEVQTEFCDQARVEAGKPKVAFALVLKGRESKPRFWLDWFSDHKDRKGQKVVRL